MRYIDSHCHLHDDRIIHDMPHIIDRAARAGVDHMVTCSTMESNFQTTARLAESYKSVLPCYGIHPWFLDSRSPGWQEVLAEQAGSGPWGIGETGLDFMDKTADQDLQIKVFKYHLELALEFERPINIHIRKAWDGLIRILKKTGPLKTPGLIHSYSGSADMASVLEKYNLYLSFSGSVTRPNAKKTVKALGAVSMERLLLETDSPDIYPSLGDDPPSSTLNEPANVPAIAGFAARLKGMDEKTFCDRAYANSLNIFNPILR